MLVVERLLRRIHLTGDDAGLSSSASASAQLFARTIRSSRAETIFARDRRALDRLPKRGSASHSSAPIIRPPAPEHRLANHCRDDSSRPRCG